MRLLPIFLCFGMTMGVSGCAIVRQDGTTRMVADREATERLFAQNETVPYRKGDPTDPKNRKRLKLDFSAPVLTQKPSGLAGIRSYEELAEKRNQQDRLNRLSPEKEKWAKHNGRPAHFSADRMDGTWRRQTEGTVHFSANDDLEHFAQQDKMRKILQRSKK